MLHKDQLQFCCHQILKFLLFKCLYHKRWQFSCHLTTGINVKNFSLENVLSHIVYRTKICVSLYHKGWQFGCQLTTGINIKDVSLENVYACYNKLHKNKCKFILYGVAVQLPPNYRYKY